MLGELESGLMKRGSILELKLSGNFKFRIIAEGAADNSPVGKGGKTLDF